MNDEDSTCRNVANQLKSAVLIYNIFYLPHYGIERFLCQQCFLLFQHGHFRCQMQESHLMEGRKLSYSVMLYSNMKHFTVLLNFYVLETFIQYLFDTLCIHCLNSHRKTTQYNFFCIISGTFIVFCLICSCNETLFCMKLVQQLYFHTLHGLTQ